MKVLFLKDNPPQALAGDVLEVKKGFGRNYLLPRQIAVVATAGALEAAAELRAEATKRRKLQKKEWVAIAERLGAEQVVIQARCSDAGRLYGSVAAATIAEKVAETIDRPFNKKQVRIGQPIKTAGTHSVKLLIYEDVQATLKLVVEPEKQSGDAAAQAESTEAPTETQVADAEASADAQTPTETEAPPAKADAESDAKATDASAEAEAQSADAPAKAKTKAKAKARTKVADADAAADPKPDAAKAEAKSAKDEPADAEPAAAESNSAESDAKAESDD